MKALPFIALAACAAFLIVRQTTAVSISKQNDTLEERIKDVEESGGGGAGSPDGGPSAATKTGRTRTTREGAGDKKGESLAHYGHDSENNANAALEQVRELHAANPSDDILVGFLQHPNATLDKDTARELAGQIRDQERRNEILERLNK